MIAIKNYNTFGIEAHATRMVVLTDLEQLATLPLPVKVIGGGSNILLTKDINETVLLNRLKGIDIIKEDQDNVWLKVQSGEIWHAFVVYCVEQGFFGIENLALIPGSVGAAPMQNIGAYGVEVKSFIESVEWRSWESGDVQEIPNSDCAFGYRESVFKKALHNKGFILAVTFKLSKTFNPQLAYGSIKDELPKDGVVNAKMVMDAVIKIRQSKLPDPIKIGNAGSFFKNPMIPLSHFETLKATYPDMPSYATEDAAHVKVPAGWLIEKAGWKGKRFDNYGVHDKQALVLVNYGQAEGKAIWDLSEEIIKSIQSQFSIDLEREVNIW